MNNYKPDTDRLEELNMVRSDGKPLRTTWIRLKWRIRNVVEKLKSQPLSLLFSSLKRTTSYLSNVTWAKASIYSSIIFFLMLYFQPVTPEKLLSMNEILISLSGTITGIVFSLAILDIQYLTDKDDETKKWKWS